MDRRRNLKQLFKLLGQSALFWTFAFFSYAIFRFYGLEQEIISDTSQSLKSQSFSVPLLISSVIGFGLGLLYGLVDFLHEKYILKRVSLGKGVFLNMLFHFIITIFVFTLGISLFSKILPINFDVRPGWWLTDKRFWAAMWYIVLCSLVFSFKK